MKHIKTFEVFIAEAVAGAKLNSFVQEIELGRLYRFTNVGNTQETSTLPVGSLHSMKTFLQERKLNIHSPSNGVICNICFPDSSDNNKYYVYYTEFNEQSFKGDENLIDADNILNKTEIGLKEVIKDDFNESSTFVANKITDNKFNKLISNECKLSLKHVITKFENFNY